MKDIDDLRPVEHLHDDADDLAAIEARLQRHRHGHADLGRQLLHLRIADPFLGAASGRHPFTVADLAAPQRRQCRCDDRACGVGDPEFLREIGVAFGFEQKLQNAPIGIARDGVIAHEAELRPDRKVLLAIEQQPLELLVALRGECLKVEADAFLERDASSPVADESDDDDRQQRERDRHDRELPPDAEA